MKVLIAGDFCPRDRVAEKFEKGDYDSVLGEVKDIISGADYSIVNFECPVANGGEKPIEKFGPNSFSPRPRMGRNPMMGSLKLTSNSINRY